MFIPSYDAILESLGTSREKLVGQTRISIPVALLKFLLQIAVKHSSIDEREYLKMNPDVGDALRRREIESASNHYISYGYMEGRKGGSAEVDEKWYREKNPDVAAAIRSGKIRSASEHYWAVGARECRAPNQAMEQECALWRAMLIESTASK
jgi:hypothetical protein